MKGPSTCPKCGNDKANCRCPRGSAGGSTEAIRCTQVLFPVTSCGLDGISSQDVVVKTTCVH